MILRSKIMKNTSVSNLNLARSAMKNLFTRPLSEENSAAAGGKRLFTQPRNSGILWREAADTRSKWVQIMTQT
jgi:hypothetical protein